MKSLFRLASLVVLAVSAAGSLGAQKPATKSPTPGGYDEGYLIFRSADSAFEYTLDGRIQVDGALYRGGESKLASGTEIRRARIGMKTTLFRDWHGEFDVDFVENAVEMKDMWIGYIGLPHFLFKAGNFKEPFSMETVTSSKFITFMERSYIDNLSPDRHIGASVTNWGQYHYASAGVFGQEAGTPDETGVSEATAFTARLAIAPLNRDGNTIHLGGAFSRRTTDAAEGADTNTVRFRSRPETDISQVRFLNTGKIRFTDNVKYYNGEFAATYGPAMLHSEYTKVTVDRLGDRPSASFDGMFVSASLLLTGERRTYLTEFGEFDRVFPRSRSGAWEVAARWSTLDLNDMSEGVEIDGGRGTNFTVGVNWHMNANFKWMLNYVRVSNDANAVPDYGPGPLEGGDKFHIIQTRLSLAF